MNKLIFITTLLATLFFNACAGKYEIPKESPCACYDIVKVS